MIAPFIATWMIGLLAAGTLSAVVRSESPRVVRAARVGLALFLPIELFVAAMFFVATPRGSGAIQAPPESSSWWVIALGAGIPVVLLTGIATRRAYAGHRLSLLAALLATAALYLAFPFGFVPPSDALTGLGRFYHEHHAFDVLAFFAPTLILLAGEALRVRETDPDHLDATLPERLRRTPRGVVVGIAIAVVAAILLLGLSGMAAFYAICIVLVGLVLFGWWSTRAAAGRMRRGFE